jgi:uncharacterized protein (TIGR02145 family)
LGEGPAQAERIVMARGFKPRGHLQNKQQTFIFQTRNNLMKTKLLTIISISLLFTGMSFGAPKKGTMKDSRDGQTYKTVKIGNQVWMAENLNYKMSSGSYHAFDEEFYEWESALNACPSGWHLPSAEEFETLIANTGGHELGGKNLKSITSWLSGGEGVDAFGFNGMGRGLTDNGGETVLNYRMAAFFWSNTDVDKEMAVNLLLTTDDEVSLRVTPKYGAFTVRCLKNSGNGEEETVSSRKVSSSLD